MRILSYVRRFAVYSFFLFLVVSLQLFSGCAAGPPQIITPTPNFSWEPPSKDSSQDINLALVTPAFGKDSKFVSYNKNLYLKTFLDSAQTDLQRALLAKGFTVTGPYESFDVMTFPNKKDSPLALVPEFVLQIDEKYKDFYRNDDGSYIKMNGNIVVNGFIKFTMVEPISEQKIWIKKINIPEQTESIDVNLMISDLKTGRLNALNSNKDNRDAALVNALNKVYPEVMQKLWSYLNAEEIDMMKKASVDARARKGY